MKGGPYLVPQLIQMICLTKGCVMGLMSAGYGCWMVNLHAVLVQQAAGNSCGTRNHP